MSFLTTVANTLWWISCAPGALRFHKAMNSVEQTQRRLLRRILKAGEDTVYGHLYDFASIGSVEDYQARVPLTDYEDYLPHIDAIAHGKSDVLTKGLPICFEPTSGSSSASKLIPYTHALRTEYQAAIAPWIFDMFRREPRLLKGRAYWSISPAIAQDSGKGVIPVGFEDDAAYLSPAAQWLVRNTLAVPSEVAGLHDTSSFRYVTLAFLLSARDLALISVWNPTFLSLMLANLREWAPSLVRDISDGTLSPPGEAQPDVTRGLGRRLGADRGRARELEDTIARVLDGDLAYDSLWPDLRLISCWADAAASGPAEELREMFPSVKIAPKGLLATEGVVSIPYGSHEQHVLAACSHFHEFLPEDEAKSSLTAWQLQEGHGYSLILTTGGGLYRYRLHDLVRVVGFVRSSPVLQFIGRDDSVSDMFGEKLNEHHVEAVIRDICERASIQVSFALLAPDGDRTPDHYTLFIAGDVCPSPQCLQDLQAYLDEELRKNVHYAYCRDLGQLAKAEVQWFGGARLAWNRYFERCRQLGVKQGDIKPRSLERGLNWRSALCCDTADEIHPPPKD